MRTLWVVDLGLIPYDEALHLQHALVATKKADADFPDVLLLQEHPPVITIGRNGDESNIVAPRETLEQLGFQIFRVERGGDVTYHGPGQLVGYPILNLRHVPKPKDVGWFVWAIQEALIRVLADFGIRGERIEKVIGVWVRGQPMPELDDSFGERVRQALASAYARYSDRKIVAIGARIEEWISYHGFALNVNTNLHHFDFIVPCGLRDRGVTSMERELGHTVSMPAVKARTAYHFGRVFQAEPVWREREELEALFPPEALEQAAERVALRSPYAQPGTPAGS